MDILRKLKATLRPLKVRVKDITAHVFYTIIFAFSHKRNKRETKYYCSICAIFKNEGPYLREWIEYHLMIGFDHIFLYNNFSTDNYVDIVQPYVNKGLVTLTDWPVKYGQISAYEDCARKYRNDTKWMLFIDLDEFVCPCKVVDIKLWLKRFEKYPAVKMYWLIFGTNGIIESSPDKLVIEQYTCSWSNLRNVGKVAWNTDYEPCEIYNEHFFCKYKFMGKTFRLPMINESHHFIAYSTAEKLPKRNTLQINHYWSKSIREYICKTNRGDAFSETYDERRLDLDFFYWHEHQNVREEKTIFRFLAQLKVRLGYINMVFDRRKE